MPLLSQNLVAHGRTVLLGYAIALMGVLVYMLLRPTCVLPAAELVGVGGGGDAKEGVIIGGRQQGAKLLAVVRLIKSTPGDERVLVFVQFMDLLVKVHEALAQAGVPTAMLKGTANMRL